MCLIIFFVIKLQYIAFKNEVNLGKGCKTELDVNIDDWYQFIFNLVQALSVCE